MSANDASENGHCEFVRRKGQPPYCERPARIYGIGDGAVVHACEYHRAWVLAERSIERSDRG